MLALGIDIGTTSIAAVLISMPDNTAIGVISQKSNAHILSSHEWEHLQDPHKILHIVQHIMDEIKTIATRPISCIGISSQMHGFLYVDEKGLPLSSLYTWQDQRAAIPLDIADTTTQTKIQSEMQSQEEHSAISVILKHTGQSIPSGYAFATHYYNTLHKIDPQVPYTLMSIGSYIGMRLCNNTHTTIDPSEAASFGLFDVVNMKFNMEAIHILWKDAQFLPDVVPFYHCMGNTSDGTPVFQSLGDNQASFMGAMNKRHDCFLINIGTGGQISCMTTEVPTTPLTHMELRPYPFYPPVTASEQERSHYLLVGSTLAGGQTLSLLATFFQDVLSFFGKKTSLDDIYAVINAQSQKPPLPFLEVSPYFLGTRENPHIRGSISHIHTDNFTATAIVDGFARAIVHELRDIITINLLNKNAPLKEIVGSGNCIKKNAIIRSHIEKAFHCKLYVSPLEEEAACGAAYYAFMGLQTAL